VSSRKDAVMIGITFALVLIGLIITVGLFVGVLPTSRAVGRPEHLPLATSRRALSTAVAYITLAPGNTPTVTQPLLRPTDTPSPSSTATPVPGNTPTDNTPEAMHSPVDTPTDTPVPSPTPTLPFLATATPTPIGSTPTSTPTSTDAPAPNPTPLAPGRITGRVLLDGTPVRGNVALRLEDQAYNLIAETTVGADGVYVLPDLDPSSEGYNVAFAQEWNAQYSIDQVVSWGWIGPIAVEDGEVIEVPDFEISLQGFKKINPEPNASFSATALSSENPILFEWTAYPQADTYWVDLVRGEEQEMVWQSTRVQATSLAFNGRVGNGTHIQPGEYWWGVGARRALGPYLLTVYGYLPVFMIEP
jgi:hypothetical protein